MQTPFDEILLYNKYSNSIYLNIQYYSKIKKFYEMLNQNYTFCSDDFEPCNIDSKFNTEKNCSYYKILLKNPNPYITIKYISFFSFNQYKGPKFNVQYQNDDFLNYDNIIKLIEFLTNTNIYQNIYFFDKEKFDQLVEKGYYYFFDNTYNFGISLDFHIFEYCINNNCIQDIKWTSDNRIGKVTKNLSEHCDEWSCYN